MGQYVFKLPDVGEGTAEAEIVAWHVRVGDVVKEDAPLVDVMTDKATVEMTSPVAGKVVSLHGEPGEMAPVGAAIAVFEVAGEEGAAEPAPAPPPPPAAAPKPNGAAHAAAAAPPAPQPKPKIKAQSGAVWSEAETQAAMSGASGAPARQAPAPAGKMPAVRERTSLKEWGPGQASPAVRARAMKLGVDLSSIRGTGPDGRVTHDDLDAMLVPSTGYRGSTALAEKHGIEPVKVIGLRRKIAEKMQEAKRRIPHFATSRNATSPNWKNSELT